VVVEQGLDAGVEGVGVVGEVVEQGQYLIQLGYGPRGTGCCGQRGQVCRRGWGVGRFARESVGAGSRGCESQSGAEGAGALALVAAGGVALVARRRLGAHQR